MRLCSDPLQHGSHQGDLHLWQKFHPCSKCPVWIQSNQLLPQHAQITRDPIMDFRFVDIQKCFLLKNVIFNQANLKAAKVDKIRLFLYLE